MSRRRIWDASGDKSPDSIQNLPGETVGDSGQISEDSSDESNISGGTRKEEVSPRKGCLVGNSNRLPIRKASYSRTRNYNSVHNSGWQILGMPIVYLLVPLAVIVGIISGIAFVVQNKENRNFQHDLVEMIGKIRGGFPSQKSTLWRKAYSAVITPFNTTPTHPAVLLLLYSDDHGTSDCLVSEIAEQSSLYLLSAAQSPLILDASDSDFKRIILENNDTFIEDYQNKVKDQVTMVVKNLQNLPTIIAEKLHFFCDEYEPLVPKAVYIFTMKVPFSNEKPTDVAEEAFKKAWGEAIESDKLGPLITRLTSEVEFVKPEEKLPC